MVQEHLSGVKSRNDLACTSKTLEVCLPCIITWSICFLVFLSRDSHVVWWISLSLTLMLAKSISPNLLSFVSSCKLNFPKLGPKEGTACPLWHWNSKPRLEYCDGGSAPKWAPSAHSGCLWWSCSSLPSRHVRNWTRCLRIIVWYGLRRDARSLESTTILGDESATTNSTPNLRSYTWQL